MTARQSASQLDMNSKKIVQVDAPSNPNDAARKGDVDTAYSNAISRANHTGTQTASLSSHREAVLAVAFSPDGRHLATGSEDRGIALWKLDNLNNPQRGFGHTGPVYALAWRPNGESLWAGAGGRRPISAMICSSISVARL